jgi:ribosome-associated protein
MSEPPDALDLGNGLAIPLSELQMVTARSSGPGGQNVNKVESKVTLVLDLEGTPSLSAGEKARLRERLGSRVNRRGELRVSSQRHRGQAANREAAAARMGELLRGALAEDVERVPTRVPASSRRRRLAGKRQRGEVKRLRSSPPPDD